MSKRLIWAMSVMIGVFTVGCASTGDRNASAGTSGSHSSSTDSNSGYQTNAVSDTSDPDRHPLDDDTSGLDLSQRTIYFEFDSSDINPTGQEIIARFAQHLTKNATSRLRLEGHADERGTREYNIGLAERRASAVQAALIRRGVSPSQLSLVSYGEERPAVGGHSEADWAQNRRVEIVQL